MSECKFTRDSKQGAVMGLCRSYRSDKSLAKVLLLGLDNPSHWPRLWLPCQRGALQKRICESWWAELGTKQCSAFKAANCSAGCISKGWPVRWGKGSFFLAQYWGEHLEHQSGVPQDRRCAWEFSGGLPGQLQGWRTWQRLREMVQHRLQKGGLRQLNCIFSHLTKGYRDRTRSYRVTEQRATAKSCRKVNSG